MSGTTLPVPTQEVRCARCGAVNRVGAYSLNKLPRCGKCQTALPEPFGRRVQRQLLAHWQLLTVAALVGGAIWWQPVFLTELFKEREQSPAAKAIAEYCARFPQPATGILAVDDPDDRIAPLTIKTSPGGGYFVKLEESISGNVVMTFFIVGGETLRVRVPEGSFILKYATGDRWCGEANLFGQDTATKQADDIFIFVKSRGYNIELIARKGGNLRTKTIDRSRF
jgi:hypothetical protein